MKKYTSHTDWKWYKTNFCVCGTMRQSSTFQEFKKHFSRISWGFSNLLDFLEKFLLTELKKVVPWLLLTEFSSKFPSNHSLHINSTKFQNNFTRSGDKDIRKLAKCSIDGKTYREGERFFPQTSSCHFCICSSTFDASIPPASNKDCHLIDCEMEIHYFDELRKGCVPVYHSKSSCCPMRFRCRKLFLVLFD